MCERCEAEPGPGRYCATCGADQRPDEPRLRTQESLDAGLREERWLAEHPDVARALLSEEEAAARQELEQERARRDGTRPPDIGKYRDLRSREIVARAFVVANTLLAALLAIFAVMHVAVVTDRTAQLDAYVASLDRLAGSYIALRISFCLSGVAVIVWLFRARKNASALGARQLRFGPGWSIGGWLVPILSLWRPKQVVNEVWRSSDPELPAHPGASEWERRPLPALLACWWGAFLTAVVLDRLSRILGPEAVTHERLVRAAWVLLAAAICMTAAGLLTVVLLRRLSARQHRRHEMLQALPDEQASPMPAGEPVPA